MAKKTKLLLPVLPLRDIVIFPKMIVPLFIGREKSIAALDLVLNGTYSHLILLTQKAINQDDPQDSDVYHIGTLGNILQMLKLPDGTIKVLIEGVERISVGKIVTEGDYLMAAPTTLNDEFTEEDTLEELKLYILDRFEQYLKLNRKIPLDIMVTLNQIEDPIKLIDTVCSYLPVDMKKKQELLETLNVEKRASKLLGLIDGEIAVLNIEKKVRGRVKRQMEKSQREYYLNEQLKAIHKELGDGDDARDEASEFEDRIKKTNLSKDAKEKAYSELKKLKAMNQSSAEASVVRNYLDWLLSVPWGKKSKIVKDLSFAEKSLNEDHYGLDKVKERILEYLAVQARVGKIKSQILCLVGPPGVGKTSLGKSIAKATGRQYVRIALGGIRDEAEIRGHRRTYIGSMPGKIIQGMKKAKTSNPLFLLDEVDKMTSDWRGDPSSALLEVLDPEQNNTFNDNYLEVDYDLSDVMFITTANTLNMPQPLLDRMEIIRLPGYTESEKMEISKNYLIPKQKEVHGLKKNELTLTDDAIKTIIRYYTREAGVRSLERDMAKISRKVVRQLSLDKKLKNVQVEEKDMETYLGVKKFQYGMVEESDQVGVSTGLAWTEFGGELLSIEAITVPGKGKIQITGKLGEVMQESVQAAISYVRSRAVSFGIKPNLFEKRDIHIHIPEGAIPKDGPSAGITIATALVSAMTGIPVRKDVAMTGEVTLRGRVLPIGGLKEKLLAAHRGNFKTIVIPEDNKKDLNEIPENVKEGLKICPVSTVDEVLQLALLTPVKAIEWNEEAEELILKNQMLKLMTESLH